MDLIGEALVKIRPDLTGLKFQVQSEVAAALGGIPATSLGATAGATTALAGATGVLATETRGLAGAAILAADAEGTLALALQTAGIRAGTAAAETVALASAQLGLVGSGTGAAAAGTAAGAGGAAGAKGFKQLADQSNIARGALIGLSRVTPVAVFGLGIAGTAAIAAATGIREAITQSADFEQQLNIFRVVAEATGEEMKEVADRAKDLGRDLTIPGASAGDAAAGMTELAKAGLSVRDSVDAARGSLQLAAAAEIDAGLAAQIAASNLNAFNLPGREASRVADLLAASSIAAQGEITDMASALAQSGSVAKQANISIDDTVTAISLLAKNGLLGSDAGTSLRTTILRLVPTTKEAAQFVKALGIEFEDSAGNLRPLPAIFEDYRTTLAKLPPVLRQAALQQIFGQDAIRAASILTREGARGFGEMADEVTREGVAAEVAAAKSQGFSGAVAGLRSNAETLAITLGSVALPALTEIVFALAEVAGAADLAAEQIIRLSEVNIPGTDFGFGDIAEHIVGNVTGVNQLRTSIEGVRAGFNLFKDDVTGLAALDQTLEATAKSFREQGLQISENDKRLEKLVLRLGRVPTVQEVRLIVGAESLGEFDRGLNEVVSHARKAGTNVPGAFASAIRERNEEASEAAVLLTEQIRRGLVEPAKKIGKDAGGGLTEALGAEITRTEQRAIDAARQALTRTVAAGKDAMEDAIEAANDAVRQAAVSASENLEQLGNDLDSQIQTLIDTGPIAQEIERLQDQLDTLRDRGEKRNLGGELRDAQAELAEAQTSIGAFEFTTPEQRRQVEEFLRPFEDRVKDAKSALAEFKLEDKIESLEDAQQAAKDAAEKGLANLVQRFKDGKISAGEFQTMLTRQLQPAIDTLNSKAGKNLGLSFTSEFFQNVENLRDQVVELVGFLGIASPSDVVSPGDERAEQDERIGDLRSEQNQRVADARKNLAQVQADARMTAESTAESSETLRRIERILQTTAARAPGSPGGARVTPGEQRQIDLTAVTRG